MKAKNEIGLKFGKLTIISEVNPFILPCGQPNRAYLCKCECGNEKVIRRVHLVNGKTTTCGCFKRPYKGDGTEKLRKVWRQIKSRCSSEYFESHLYFKKGIKVCEEWMNDWFSFKKWSLENGYKEGLVIDRSDNSKGYNPDNCRWVTQLVNSMNKDNNIMVEYKGEIKSLKLIITERKQRQHYEAIYTRIKRGWNAEKAIDTPIRKGNYYTTKTKEQIDNENELMFSRL